MSKNAGKADEAATNVEADQALQKEQLTELNMELNNKHRKLKAL